MARPCRAPRPGHIQACRNKQENPARSRVSIFIRIKLISLRFPGQDGRSRLPVFSIAVFFAAASEMVAIGTWIRTPEMAAHVLATRVEVLVETGREVETEPQFEVPETRPEMPGQPTPSISDHTHRQNQPKQKLLGKNPHHAKRVVPSSPGNRSGSGKQSRHPAAFTLDSSKDDALLPVLWRQTVRQAPQRLPPVKICRRGGIIGYPYSL